MYLRCVKHHSVVGRKLRYGGGDQPPIRLTWATQHMWKHKLIFWSNPKKHGLRNRLLARRNENIYSVRSKPESNIHLLFGKSEGYSIAVVSNTDLALKENWQHNHSLNDAPKVS